MAELRRLIALILVNDIAEDHDEALAVALADPVAALASFRALVADCPDSKVRVSDDDRRQCNECANLSLRDHRCLAAWRGERPGNAARDLSPGCRATPALRMLFPKAQEPDQRPGAARWPHLIRGAQHV